MSKIVVKPNKLQDISMLLNQNIDGIIFPIENLSVESSFFIDIDEVINLKTSKEKIVLSRELTLCFFLQKWYLYNIINTNGEKKNDK